MKIEMGRACDICGGEERCIQILVGESEWTRPVGCQAYMGG